MTSIFSKKGAGLLIPKREETVRWFRQEEGFKGGQRLVLHTGEKGELREGRKDKSDTSKATGLANCFRNSTVDILRGEEKSKCQIQKAFLLVPISTQPFLMLRLFYCRVTQ